MDDIGESAHAIRRETRVIDEQTFALLDLVGDLEPWIDDAEHYRARIAIIQGCTAAIRARVEHGSLESTGPNPTPIPRQVTPRGHA